MMAEAKRMNPGPWVDHSRYAAQAAELIAQRDPRLDPSTAYILGYLHDIGRREGVTDLRHTLDGYRYLSSQGYEDAARICLTHSFAVADLRAYAGEWDCSSEDLEFLKYYLSTIEYHVYDRLIQLADTLAATNGYWLIEKRLVDVALRHGVSAMTVDKWRAKLEIQKQFETAIGESIYNLLPGVVENTFRKD